MFALFAILAGINIGVGTNSFPIGLGVFSILVSLYHLKHEVKP